ncbi:hypothetical protein [Erythrobacter dokdonensis]|uniref:GTPase n=1 Tax=Erythrobacter dokdonensis DSW-74 TaxID=1300349 RepID=A0A1A7BJ07_9SPHN|nr:hypothetical protein [Erythrobacter dokdonensis]OBV11185.1 hypothetical protein I603_1593 [Erythrobacter dokdonensis DSW-74]
MNRSESRLTLVYNADGGWLNALKDAVWKVARPATYPCSLCALTYGYVSMHRRWRQFLAGLPQDKVFHHRDDFSLAFPDLAIPLPAILLEQDGAVPKVLVSAAELDALSDLEALVRLVEERLAHA